MIAAYLELDVHHGKRLAGAVAGLGVGGKDVGLQAIAHRRHLMGLVCMCGRMRGGSGEGCENGLLLNVTTVSCRMPNGQCQILVD